MTKRILAVLMSGVFVMSGFGSVMAEPAAEDTAAAQESIQTEYPEDISEGSPEYSADPFLEEFSVDLSETVLNAENVGNEFSASESEQWYALSLDTCSGGHLEFLEQTAEKTVMTDGDGKTLTEYAAAEGSSVTVRAVADDGYVFECIGLEDSVTGEPVEENGIVMHSDDDSSLMDVTMQGYSLIMYAIFAEEESAASEVFEETMEEPVVDVPAAEDDENPGADDIGEKETGKEFSEEFTKALREYMDMYPYVTEYFTSDPEVRASFRYTFTYDGINWNLKTNQEIETEYNSLNGMGLDNVATSLMTYTCFDMALLTADTEAEKDMSASIMEDDLSASVMEDDLSASVMSSAGYAYVNYSDYDYREYVGEGQYLSCGYHVIIYNGTTSVGFCAHHTASLNVASGTLTVYESSDENLRKVCYYGFSGPCQVSGYDDTALFNRTSLACSVLVSGCDNTSGLGSAFIGAVSGYSAPPSNFHVYVGSPAEDNQQPVVFWQIEYPTYGSVSMTKGYVSGYEPTGAVYWIYDSNHNNMYCGFMIGKNGTGYAIWYYGTNSTTVTGTSVTGMTNLLKNIKVDGKSSSSYGYARNYKGKYWIISSKEKTISLAPGTYYLKEIMAPANEAYGLQDEIKFTVQADVNTAIPATKAIDELEPGFLSLKKTAEKGYSVKGAVYTVYSDKTCKKAVGKLTVKSDGSSNVLTISTPGTYYIKETYAPKPYALDTEVYSQKILPGKTTVLSVKEPLEPGVGSLIKTGDNNHSVEGAVYCVYGDSSCEAGKELGKLTVGENGVTNEISLDEGTYYVKETYAPKPYAIDNEVHVLNIKAGKTTVLKVTDKISAPVIISVTKKSANPAITDGNPCYSLEGAVFAVYDSYNNAVNDTGRLITLTTDVNGCAESEELYLNDTVDRVYVREIQAPEGYILPDTEESLLKSVSVSKSETSVIKYSVEFEDDPRADTAGIEIIKESAYAVDNNFSLAGTVFRIEYFTNMNGDVSGTPEREWVLATQWNDEKSCYLCELSPDYMISDPEYYVTGADSDLYKNADNKSVIPFGTVRITEVRPANGYSLEDIIYRDENGEVISQSASIISVVTEETGETRLKVGNVFTDYNVPVEISTVASDSVTKDRHGRYTATTGVTDTASIKFADPSYNFLIKGTLKDLKTDEIICTAETEFTPQTVRNSSVSLAFTPEDPSVLEGRAVYVTEELYRIEGDEKYLVATEEGKDSESQHVYYPSISTTLTADRTGAHVDAAAEDSSFTDTVRCTGLKSETEYTLKCTLMDVTDNKVIGNGTTVFTAASYSAEKTVQITCDTTGLEGHTFVAYEELYTGGNLIAEHKDPDDEDQSVHIPQIRTVLSDGSDEGHIILAGENNSASDTVYYSNLVPGREYEVMGTLIDKDTGLPVTDKSGNAVAASVTFTADSSEGSVDVPFSFSTKASAGHTVVAVETLYYNGKAIAEHYDLDDEDQSVSVPAVSTYLYEIRSTGEKMKDVLASQNTELVDEITYKNFIPGKEYTIRTWLTDEATGSPVTQDRYTETVFIPETPDGVTDVTISFDSSDLAGCTIVALEYIYLGEKLVAMHADRADVLQKVYLPQISTTLTDTATKDKEILSFSLKGTSADIADIPSEMNAISLTDTVEYKNLRAGHEYTLRATLVNKADGQPVLDDNGVEVTAVKTFVPEETDGTVEVVFEFAGITFAGTTAVAFERLYNGSALVAIHEDIEDEAQTVTSPGIRTYLTENSGYKNFNGTDEAAVFTDTVTYTNLIPGQEYTVSGFIAEKSGNGATVTGSTTFVPETSEGVVEVDFVFDKTPEPGTVYVAYEMLKNANGNYVAVHMDSHDKDQTVYVPSVKTTLKSEEGLDNVFADEETVLRDTVVCTDLEPGKTYTVKGVLMDKATGLAFTDAQGSVVTAETQFTVPQISDDPSASSEQTVELEFRFDASAASGFGVVAFEQIYDGDVLAAIHEDISDEDQSVYFPEIHTELSPESSETSGSSLLLTLTDTVSYSNLMEGHKYMVTGVIMDKDTEAPVVINGESVTGSAEFTAQTGNLDEADSITCSGVITVPFSVSEEALEGHTLVAFEKIYEVAEDGTQVLVGEHEDINDEDQSYVIPVISTTLTDGSGNKQLTPAVQTTLKDTVSYSGLVPGETYVAAGTIMDKSTGNALSSGDSEVTAQTRFVPETADGAETVTFTVDTSALAGKTIVAFEKLYLVTENEGGEEELLLLAVHEEINDSDQSVVVTTTPKTGDESSGCLWLMLAVISWCGPVSVWIIRRKRRTSR